VDKKLLLINLRECFQENGGIREVCFPQQVGGTHTGFTVHWPARRSSGCPRSFGQLALVVWCSLMSYSCCLVVVTCCPSSTMVTLSTPWNRLQVSPSLAISALLGMMFNPSGPSAQAQNLVTLQYLVLEMSWSLAQLSGATFDFCYNSFMGLITVLWGQNLHLGL
jgi:hypothetical protein